MSYFSFLMSASDESITRAVYHTKVLHTIYIDQATIGVYDREGVK